MAEPKSICPFCAESSSIPTFEDGEVKYHLIVTETQNGRFHVHGPMRNRNKVEEMVTVILRESKIPYYSYSKE